jgi:GNAT superfamily N-acetyltransferase
LTSVSITLARESEAPAYIALLPRFAGGQAEFLIARTAREFAGAAAVNWVAASDPSGFHLDARVLTTHRRRGVGRALIEAAVDLAQGETNGLWALDGAGLGAPAASFLEACGFKALRREYHYEVDNAKLLADSAELAARLRARGRVPERAEIGGIGDQGARQRRS